MHPIFDVDLPNQKMSEEELTTLLYLFTGNFYRFETQRHLIWDDHLASGTFYQIMPENKQDHFYYWYSTHRRDKQFFETMHDAVLHFLWYWIKWSDAGRPEPC